MSAHWLETTKEPGEKQEATLSQEETLKGPVEGSSEGLPLREKQGKNDTDKPSDSIPHKATNSDTEKDTYNASTPSDLSTGSSRESKDIPKDETPIDNTSLVAGYYNALKAFDLMHRNQSRIVYMRNFNNWIKGILIDEYLDKAKHNKTHGSSIKVLDMCCGKGGDLFKWKKKNITHLICADIAEVSLEQCQHRYNEMLSKSINEREFVPLFATEFISADCTKVRLREKYKDPSMQLDLVSCQFAFHYSFESLQQAECMLRNASETLRPGGYFIGTIPDAYDLVSRWQKCDGNKFGNDIYKIEFMCEDKQKPPLFGAKYNFYLEGVVNCPEFLVHLPTFRKLASKFGLELVMFERFDSYYERMKKEGRSLLGKMQALETYPPYHETPLLGQLPQDYRHAVQYMQKLPDHRKIGTLSLSEWEVVSLYAIFVFQKLKTTWNSDGKPEYVKL